MSYCMLTTVDNPFDPSSDFNNWFYFDETSQYCSCERLYRTAIIDETMSEAEVAEEIERAIDEIVLNDASNVFKKLVYSDEGKRIDGTP